MGAGRECRLSCAFPNKSSIFGFGALVDRPRSRSRDYGFSGASILHSQICCIYEDYYDLCGHTEE
jgi:hypothetical protein